jgi:hypothetical protein
LTPISTHPRLYPTRTRLIAWFAAVLLGFAALAIVAILIISILNVLPLLFITALFFTVLVTPVLLLTSLHPAIDVYEEGLQVTPLIWKSHFIPWESLSHLTRHRLLGPPPPERSGKKEVEGLMIVGDHGKWHFRVVGIFAGQRGKPVFAISDRTHQDYNKLRFNLKKSLPLHEDDE